MAIVNLLKRNSESLNDTSVIEKITSIFRFKFWLYLGPLKNLKILTWFDQLMGSLQAFEERIKRKNQDKLEQVLQTKLTLKDNKTLMKEVRIIIDMVMDITHIPLEGMKDDIIQGKRKGKV